MVEMLFGLFGLFGIGPNHLRGLVRYFEDECGLYQEAAMKLLKRITVAPQVMGGKPCIRNLRITIGTIVGLISAGRTTEEVLDAYPYLEGEDILEALSYAAWRAEEIEVSLGARMENQRLGCRALVFHRGI